jgi:hypothetical protein
VQPVKESFRGSHSRGDPRRVVLVLRATAIAVALGNLFGGKFVGWSDVSISPEIGGEF